MPKKEGLDKSIPSNYRPVSNLNNISKILERLFLNRIQPHITSSLNFNPFQSAYRRHHSTETALLLSVNNICHEIDNGNCSLLVSLDLSSAFDTVDHSILTNLLGFRDSALSWIKAYLVDRQQFVRIGTAVSSTLHLASGVPPRLCPGASALYCLYFSYFLNSCLSQHQPTAVCR